MPCCEASPAHLREGPPIYAAFFLTLLPAGPPRDFVRIDWSHAVPADPAIAAIRGQYATALNAGDGWTAAALYSPDALMVLCDGTFVRGQIAVGMRIAELSHTHEREAVTLRPRRFSSSATVASETGTFTETIADQAGTKSVEGVYLTIYSRRPGGPWRIALEARTTGHARPLVGW